MSPISPKAASPSRTGRPFAAEAIASAIPRSAPGSSMRTPPGDVDEDVGAAERQPGVAGEHGDDHREPLRVDAGADAARHREVGRRDERLDLEQERPRPLERAGDRGADLARLAAPEERGRVGDADEAGARHLEDAELVRRAEAVLHRAQDAVRVVAVALELEHAVDEMLEHARAGDRAVLRHVADEEGRDARLLRDPQQPRRRLAHLRDRAGRRADLRRPERLHRVDHADGGPLALERRADRVELGLGEDLDVVAAAEPRGAQLHLRDRLLAGDEQRAPLARDRAERREQQRRLADARLAADEHERRRHEPAAEHAVELGRRRSGSASASSADDVDEAKRRPRRARAAAAAAARGHRLGDHRPELAAAGAAPEPAAGRRAALGARVLNGRRLRHRARRYA